MKEEICFCEVRRPCCSFRALRAVCSCWACASAVLGPPLQPCSALLSPAHSVEGLWGSELQWLWTSPTSSRFSEWQWWWILTHTHTTTSLILQILGGQYRRDVWLEPKEQTQWEFTWKLVKPLVFTGLFNSWIFYCTLLGPGLSHPCLENALVESCPAEHLELLVSGICNSRFPTSLLILGLGFYLFGCFLSHLLC